MSTSKHIAVTSATFMEVARGAGRILVINPAPLGDALHGLMVLRAIAAGFPGARLDVLSIACSEVLLKSVPAVDRVMAVQWHPRLADRALMRRVRREALRQVWQTAYDAVIDLKPSDRSIPFVLAARARWRLGVRCFSYGLPHRWLYTHLADQPWRNQSLYRYQLDLLALAGIGDAAVAPGQGAFVTMDAPHDLAGCVHLSFCATAAARELPPATARALLALLCERHPQRVFAVSCSASESERQRLGAIVDGLSYPNLRVLAGTLTIAQLAAVLAQARLHIGPDTGTLHLAWLQGTPTVSWFLNHEALLAWAPRGSHHRVLVSALEQTRDGKPLSGISAATLAAAVDEMLTAQTAALAGGDESAPQLRFFADGLMAPAVGTA